MHLIIGRLTAARYQDDHGIATVSLTLDQGSRYSGQRIKALRSYGREPGHHAQALADVDQAEAGALYAVHADALAAFEHQVWAMGVTHWHREGGAATTAAEWVVPAHPAHAMPMQQATEAHA